MFLFHKKLVRGSKMTPRTPLNAGDYERYGKENRQAQEGTR